MILPKTFIFTNYSKQIRKIISQYFKKASILILNGRWFPDAEESIVILLAENFTSTDHGIIKQPYRNNKQILSCIKGKFIPDIKKTIEKDWNYVLEYIPKNIKKVIISPYNKENYVKLENLISIKIGVVTGANKFFIMTKTKADTLGLIKNNLKSIITKSRLLKGLDYNNLDINLTKKNISKFLLITHNEQDKLPNEIKKYLKQGKQENIHERYKCKNRQPWHLVKRTFSPDAFLHYMSSSLPHIVLNQTSSTCTNAIHRLMWKKKYSKNEEKAIGVSSVTSLAQIYFELKGRSYGGGVLKVEPNNALEVFIPKYPKYNIHDTYDSVNASLRVGKKETAMKIADELILEDFLGYNSDLVENLRKCWKKLVLLRQSSSKVFY